MQAQRAKYLWLAIPILLIAVAVFQSLRKEGEERGSDNLSYRLSIQEVVTASEGSTDEKKYVYSTIAKLMWDSANGSRILQIENQAADSALPTSILAFFDAEGKLSNFRILNDLAPQEMHFITLLLENLQMPRLDESFPLERPEESSNGPYSASYSVSRSADQTILTKTKYSKRSVPASEYTFNQDGAFELSFDSNNKLLSIKGSETLNLGKAGATVQRSQYHFEFVRNEHMTGAITFTPRSSFDKAKPLTLEGSLSKAVDMATQDDPDFSVGGFAALDSEQFADVKFQSLQLTKLENHLKRRPTAAAEVKEQLLKLEAGDIRFHLMALALARVANADCEKAFLEALNALDADPRLSELVLYLNDYSQPDRAVLEKAQSLREHGNSGTAVRATLALGSMLNKVDDSNLAVEYAKWMKDDYLNEKDAEKRAVKMGAIGNFAEEALLGLIQDALTDPASSVRLAAINALRKYTFESTRELLFGLIASASDDEALVAIKVIKEKTLSDKDRQRVDSLAATVRSERVKAHLLDLLKAPPPH